MSLAENQSVPRARFRDVITTEDELRDIVGHPKQRTLDKVVRVIDENSRTFIAHAPFVLIASVMEGGLLDISPKGDPAGFVKVLDETTLAIPDRLGNRRLDTFRNILKNPNVGLIFLIPGVNHTLRVSGKASIVRDEDLRRTMTVNDKAPDHVIVLDVEHVLAHCPKCMTRSGLWQPETWIDPVAVPTLAEIIVAHAKLAMSADEMQAVIDEDARERLY